MIYVNKIAWDISPSIQSEMTYLYVCIARTGVCVTEMIWLIVVGRVLTLIVSDIWYRMTEYASQMTVPILSIFLLIYLVFTVICVCCKNEKMYGFYCNVLMKCFFLTVFFLALNQKFGILFRNFPPISEQLYVVIELLIARLYVFLFLLDFDW